MNNTFYSDILDRVKDVEEEINSILWELDETESHKEFVKIFGESIANQTLYSASQHMKNVSLCIKNEIKHLEEGRL